MTTVVLLMKVYPFLISHCKTTGLYLLTGFHCTLTQTEREKERECELEGGKGGTVVHSEPKKAVAVSKELKDREGKEDRWKKRDRCMMKGMLGEMKVL